MKHGLDFLFVIWDGLALLFVGFFRDSFEAKKKISLIEKYQKVVAQVSCSYYTLLALQHSRQCFRQLGIFRPILLSSTPLGDSAPCSTKTRLLETCSLDPNVTGKRPWSLIIPHMNVSWALSSTLIYYQSSRGILSYLCESLNRDKVLLY